MTTAAPYCSENEIISVLSESGIDYSADDNRSGEAEGREASFVAEAIQRAEVRINQYLMQRYDLTTMPGNKWIKWCCATFAGVFLMRRRGETAPDGLINQAMEYETWLHNVWVNNALIPTDAEDTNTAQLLHQNSGIMMSNLAIDQRFRVSKVRSVPRISTGPQSSKTVRHPDYRSTFFWD